jgi:hypothetical protein
VANVVFNINAGGGGHPTAVATVNVGSVEMSDVSGTLYIDTPQDVIMNNTSWNQVTSNISAILDDSTTTNLRINQQLQLTDGTVTATFGPTGLSTDNPSGLSVASNINLNNKNISNGNTITATSFVGALTGNATTATTATTAQNATNASLIQIIDQPTTGSNYYLAFSLATSGFLQMNVDSAQLTYNPSTNLLFVNGLQLSTAVNTPTYSAGTLTLSCNDATSREFSFNMTGNITQLAFSNARINGVYKVYLYNNTLPSTNYTIGFGSSLGLNVRSTWTTSITVSTQQYYILTIKYANFFVGARYYCCSIEQFQ